MRFKALITLSLILAFALPAQAGWIITTNDMDGEATHMLVKNQMVRINTDEEIIVLDLNKGEVAMCDQERKLFWQGKPEDMRKEMVSAIKAQMEAEMKSMPKAQQDAMKQMMLKHLEPPKGPKPSVKVIALGKSKTIAGRKAAGYEIKVDGKLKETLWLADVDDMRADLDPGKLSGIINQMAAMGREVWRLDPAIAKLMNKGLPFMTSEVDDDGEVMTTKVSAVKKADLTMDQVKVPAGYRKAAAADLMK